MKKEDIISIIREWKTCYTRMPYVVTKEQEEELADLLLNGGYSEWHSVDLDMPEENVSVLVKNQDGKCLDEREPVIAHLENGKWFSVAWWNFNLCSNPKVTHWMYLPK